MAYWGRPLRYLSLALMLAVTLKHMGEETREIRHASKEAGDATTTSEGANPQLRSDNQAQEKPISIVVASENKMQTDEKKSLILNETATDSETANTTAAPKKFKKLLVGAAFAYTERYKAIRDQRRATIESYDVFRPEEIAFYGEFPPFILNDPRWTDHLEFLKDPESPSRRIAGHGFWKAALVDHHLSQLDDGDFLLYVDSDLVNHFNWIDMMFETMVERQHNLAVYQMPIPDQKWHKRDVYETFCSGRNQTTDYGRSYASGFVVLRKSPGAVQFVKDWLEGMSTYHNINDAPSTTPNYPMFKEHRHDQSILNLLLRCQWHEPTKKIAKRPKVAENLDGNKGTVYWNVMTFHLPDIKPTAES